jgi:putative (di)nucleoside polyphosphate hydrolase
MNYRKGVSALIINKNNEVLIVNLQSFATHFFAIPGGGVDAGEELIDAAYREINEELGIKKEQLEFITSSDESIKVIYKEKKITRDGIEYDGMERFFFGFRFIGEDSDIVLQPEEVRTYKWVSLSDLKDYLLFDNQLEETTGKLLELFPFLK